MPRYIVGLGSSHPCGPKYIEKACTILDASQFIKVVAKSPNMTTPPAGGQTNMPFTNAAVAIYTTLPPDALWHVLHQTEARLGRIRTVKNGPRTMDLDVLFGEYKFKTPNLTVPHPALFDRQFALQPALKAAINANWTDFSKRMQTS